MLVCQLRRSLMVVCVAMGCASESAKQTAQGSAAANDGTQAVEAVGSDSEVNEPFSPEVLYERFPSLHGLPEPQRVQVVAMLNTVPAPCVPCEESTIAVCVLDDKKGCENLSPLVERAVRLSSDGGSLEKIRQSISYGDVWVPIEPSSKQSANAEAVNIVVWADLSSGFLSTVVENLQQLPKEDVNLDFRPWFDPDDDRSANLAKALVVANMHGFGLEAILGVADVPAEDRTVALVKARLQPHGIDDAGWEGGMKDATSSVEQGRALGAKLGVRASPTYFINGYRLRGAQSKRAVVRLFALERWHSSNPLSPTPPTGAQ